MYALTHHEYIEVDPTAGGFVSASKYALNGGIAAAINRTVRQHNAAVNIFGGEIGATPNVTGNAVLGARSLA